MRHDSRDVKIIRRCAYEINFSESKRGKRKCAIGTVKFPSYEPRIIFVPLFSFIFGFIQIFNVEFDKERWFFIDRVYFDSVIGKTGLGQGESINRAGC